MIFFVLVIVLIVLIVSLIKFIGKMEEKKNVILRKYNGVFGKRTLHYVAMTWYAAIMLIGSIVFLIIGIPGGNGFNQLVLYVFLGGIILSIPGVIAVLMAKAKCPAELMGDLYKNILIASIGELAEPIRTSWDLFCIMMSIVPGLGWFARFARKNKGVDVDALADELEQRDKTYFENIEKERIQKEQEEARRLEEQQDYIRKKAYQNGSRKVQFSDDGERYKFEGESNYAYRSVYGKLDDLD